MFVCLLSSLSNEICIPCLKLCFGSFLVSFEMTFQIRAPLREKDECCISSLEFFIWKVSLMKIGFDNFVSH